MRCFTPLEGFFQRSFSVFFSEAFKHKFTMLCNLMHVEVASCHKHVSCGFIGMCKTSGTILSSRLLKQLDMIGTFSPGCIIIQVSAVIY